MHDEGYARDFVRAVQDARKDAGLEVSDHIAILVAAPDESIFPRVLEKFGDYIQEETLADELRLVEADYPELTALEAGEEALHLRVEKGRKGSKVSSEYSSEAVLPAEKIAVETQLVQAREAETARALRVFALVAFSDCRRSTFQSVDSFVVALALRTRNHSRLAQFFAYSQ